MADDKKDFTPPVVEKPVVEKPKASQLPAEKAAKEKERERGEVLKQIGEILAEHGNLESNIPYNHEYWELTNRFRAL